MGNVSLQINLEGNSLNSPCIFLLNVNFFFKSLNYMFFIYVLNMHVKIHSNQILFTIQSINLFIMTNFLPEKLGI